LEATGDFQNYLWNTGSTSDSILVDSMAYYSVQAIDVHGCIQLDSILVQEYPFIPPNLPFDTVSCSVQLNISIPSIYSSYLWSSGGTSNSETLNVGIFQDSLYWLSLIDTNNCVYTDSITTRLAQTSVTGDTLFCEGDSSQLSTISGSSYSWSTGEITPTIYATIDGYYSVLIMDGLGCERIGEIEIYSEPLTQIDLVNYNLSTNEFYVEFQNSDYLIWHFGDGDTLLTTTYNNSDTLVDHEYILGGNYSGYVVSFSNCNTDTIYFDIIGVGIEEYNNEISIYPNPTSGLIYLQSKNGNDNYYVTVVDVTGKLLFQENKLPPFIDLTGLSFGVYYIQIIDSKIGGLILHKKIVLVK
jgi:hypothetical protein